MVGPERTAVVTGGNDGLGREMVLALARRGWDVAFNFLTGEDRAKTLVSAVEAMGRRALAHRSDVGVKADVDAFYAALDAWGGTPDVLVNNAGVQTWSPLLELAEEDWDRVIRTNLKGCFLHTQAAARRMVAAHAGGAIVNLGSGCNLLAFPRLVDYTASKGGIEQLTKVSALELGPYGIRVNCVAPGAIETDRTRAEVDDYAGRWSPITPLRRVGTVKDVAAAVVWFAGPESAFVTGQTLLVDGGVFSQAVWPEYGNAG
ncbi:SDR family NAD(P)-dependent oxidoreductase [Sphingomonas sp. DT-51]|uniref:SDR family NAD(P)-dependent oxidoreductase n=1 Tax=Sphingomonas sp. DT-51 TaxID=3396165 RepID=UPI003F1C5ECD